jgi:Flp pilus assembly pilin Flp
MVIVADRSGRRLGTAAYRAAVLADARWRMFKAGICERWRQSARSSEAGQTTLEYALILGLISVPLAILILTGLEWLFRQLIQRIVSDFTNGPS